ncbi:F-box associated domain type 3 [Arabidopsis suecica]|uniref:F-box associated domain type 3 n=1 Tax=Arabidopsis suecica TaxID=45249 RepID=A0A8T2H9A9_ARASU|nr:F-box associated domain type 3 [Arabidopsis suecica]
MNRGANSASIPNDLILEILSRLPAKSTGRFRCVSKLWGSMLCHSYFTELFLTRSSARPRLLIGIHQDGDRFFFSCPQPQSPYDNSSIVLAADFHMKFGRVEDEWVYHILTLGTENVRWREIICPFSYDPPREKPICINGVLYYISVDSYYSLIGCFDVRSEKFKFLYLSPDCFPNWSRKLINYKEDVEKEEWTRYAYTLRPENKVEDNDYVYVVGATASGEIVLTKQNAYKPFYVFYFSPERNTLLSVEIQGVGEEWFYHNVYYFVDHVEDLRFDVMKTTYAGTSRSPPKQSTSTSSREDHEVRTLAHQKEDRLTFESVNQFDALRLLEDD